VCELLPEAASAIPLAGSDLESDLVLTVLEEALELERKPAEGKTRREAIHCLKRQIARVVFNTLKARAP